jgi:hypothetical protein
MVRSYASSLPPNLAASRRRIAVRDLGAALEHLSAALPIEPPRDPEAWVIDAARLFERYREWVDPKARISPSGPTVRFIFAALKAMGHRPTSIGALAQALQRRRKNATNRGHP